MFEEISISTVLLILLCAFFLACSVYIRVRKRELPMQLRIAFSVFAVCLGANYAYKSGSADAWLLPIALAVLLGAGIYRTINEGSAGDKHDDIH